MRSTSGGSLTRREREVLALLQQGLTNRQIAISLGISANTVNKHVQHILEKLGVENRVLAVIGSKRRAATAADERYLQAIARHRELDLVDRLRAAYIDYAEALDAEGRSDEAKEQWRLAALVGRALTDPTNQRADETAS